MIKTTDRLVSRLSPILVPLIGIAFIFSGIRHLGNPQQFLAGIVRYQLINTDWSLYAAQILPPLLVSIGVSLIFPRPHSSILRFGSFVCFLFLLVQFSAWMRGLGIDCACFGGSSEREIGIVSMAIPFFSGLFLMAVSVANNFNRSDP